MSDIKLCKDCKFVCTGEVRRVLFSTPPDPVSLWRCNHPTEFSLVDGRPKNVPYCDMQRSFNADERTCGKQGQWWEPRQ